MSLSRLYRKTTKKPLKVYWWRYEYPHKLNFGDELTPVLIEKIFGLKSIWSEPNKCELAGAGSIIEILQSSTDNHLVQVWGSGFIQEGPANTSENLKFAAVRGRLSLERLDSTKTVLGDPGLLMSLAHNAPSIKKYRVGIVPHYVDQEHPAIKEMTSKLTRTTVINVLDNPTQVAEQIASCDLVLSSSLHGLVISDSYSIPNYWLPLSSNLTGNDYKFKDYYSVFNQVPQPIDWKTLTVDSVITKLIDTYEKKKDLTHIQQQLIKSFPY